MNKENKLTDREMMFYGIGARWSQLIGRDSKVEEVAAFMNITLEEAQKLELEVKNKIESEKLEKK